MSDDDPELEELKRQVPAGWYLADDPTRQQYWDGAKWTDAYRPVEAPEKTATVKVPRVPRVPRWVVVVAVIAAAWLFFYNTNPGKRVMAELGLRECYEVTLTGEVVCGEGADRIEHLKESLR